MERALDGSLGETALALQFHAEVETASLEAWLIGHTVELGKAGLDPRDLRAQAARHDEAHRVVAAHVVSHADDAQAARRHARSTSSWRKCVAQEMHGS